MQTVFALLFFPTGDDLKDHKNIFFECLKNTNGMICVLAAQILEEIKADPDLICPIYRK
jgi:hypothetical protein